MGEHGNKGGCGWRALETTAAALVRMWRRLPRCRCPCSLTGGPEVEGAANTLWCSVLQKYGDGGKTLEKRLCCRGLTLQETRCMRRAGQRRKRRNGQRRKQHKRALVVYERVVGPVYEAPKGGGNKPDIIRRCVGSADLGPVRAVLSVGGVQGSERSRKSRRLVVGRGPGKKTGWGWGWGVGVGGGGGGGGVGGGGHVVGGWRSIDAWPSVDGKRGGTRGWEGVLCV